MGNATGYCSIPETDISHRISLAIDALYKGFYEGQATVGPDFLAQMLQLSMNLLGSPAGLIARVPLETASRDNATSSSSNSHLEIMATIGFPPPLPDISSPCSSLLETWKIGHLIQQPNSTFLIPLKREEELLSILYLDGPLSGQTQNPEETLSIFFETCAQLFHRYQQIHATPCLQNPHQILLNQYEKIMNLAGEGILGLDSNGRITFINPAAEQILGYSVDELRMQDLHATIHHSHEDGTPYPKTACAIYNAIREGKTYQTNQEIFWRQDGFPIPIEFITAPVIENDRSQGAVVIFRDLSELKAAQDTVRQNGILFRTAFHNAPIAKALSSLDGRYLMVNSAMCEMTGYSEAELLDLSQKDITYPYDMPIDIEFVRRLNNGQSETFQQEKRFLHKDGHIIWVQINISAMPGNNGKPAFFISHIQDITISRQIEYALRENEERFRRAFDDAANGMALVSTEGRFLQVNTYLCNMLGYRSDEMVGKHFQEFTYPDDLEIGPKQVKKLLTGETQSCHFEKRYIHKDGHTIWINLTSSLVQNETGEPLYFVSQLQDVTERHAMEQALRASEQNFRLAFDNAAIGMAMVSPAGHFLKVNPCLCNIMGYKESELLELNALDITHPDDLSLSNCTLTKMKTGESTSCEIEKRYIHKNGHVVWIHLTSSCVFNVRGEVVYLVSQLQDITERKCMEQALRDSEENFRRAFDDAAIGMAMVSLDGYFLKVNSKLSEVTGYSKEELLERNFQSITYPDDWEIDFHYWHKMLNGELQTCKYEKRYFHKQGHIAWIFLTGSSVCDEQGNPMYYVAQMQDITERKRMEQALRDSEERFRSAFDYASIGKALVSPDGRWLKVNRMVCRITGYSEEELLNMDFQSITHPDDLSIDLEFMQYLLQREIETYQLEKRYIHKDGHIVWIQLNVSPVCQENREITYLISQIQDITDRKIAEEQLRKAKEEAEAAASAKAEFLATMSHEIRTPMNAVLGMAALLETMSLTSEQQELVNTIKSGGKTLLSIINDILDYSKIESGKMDLDYYPFEIQVCIEEAFALFQQKATEQGLALSYRIDPNVPLVVLGDAIRLRQILVNLIGNALKFTEEGEIHIFVSMRGQPDENKAFELNFEVRDTGCGIPDDKLQIIFDSFTQVAPAISRKYGGTGLGLAICNRLVQLMGGSIWVESEVGKGSTFHFSVQSKLVDWESMAKTLPDSPYTFDERLAILYPLKILVAEDNPVNQKLISRILEKMGYSPSMAQNGRTVLEMVQNERYDIIFMDIQMPELDGLEATRQIIDQFGDIERPRIIAMTAFGLKEDRNRCLTVGMDDYISKPISAQQVEGMLKHWYQWLQKENKPFTSTIDETALMKRFAKDMNTLSEMVEIFEEDCTRLISGMRQALEDSDSETIKRHAHELKGACLALSVVQMKEVAAKVEMSAKLQQLGTMQGLIDVLEAKFHLAYVDLKLLLDSHTNTPAI